MTRRAGEASAPQWARRESMKWWWLALLVSCGGEPAQFQPRYYTINGSGYGVLVVEEHDGRARTSKGATYPLSQLKPATPSKFRGEEVVNGALTFGWGLPGAPVYASPRATTPQKLTQRTLFHDADTPGWLRAGELWIRDEDAHRPSLSRRPDGTGRWIDIDLAQQTLVAYDGDRPVFATLVSAGIGHPGTPIATPPGEHQIVTKLARADMDNLEHTGVVPYKYEAVPNVQYFEGSKALHGTLWHDRFGQPASHGCINLSPADAERLFAFTVVGTVVRVREGRDRMKP
jgi:lipoprotein-anchoring transpeptidase ErfK/SrfK